jgi:general secretion pathway protein G
MEKKTFQTVLVQNQKGFSLIEILIALTLLALAGTFVVGKFFDQLNEGKISSAKIQMSNLEARLKEFRRKCGFYPTSEQGLDALVNKPTGGRECKDYPSSGFIEGEGIPKDPWENDFIYESDGKSVNIYSYGGDGEAGGEGGDADIYLRPGKSAASAGGGNATEGTTDGGEAPQE